eukprot:4637109-Prymnesium_polylepis.1
MLAGPSEVLVLADATADPAVVAADLLAQAEHDPSSIPSLICLSTAFNDQVEAEVLCCAHERPSLAVLAKRRPAA